MPAETSIGAGTLFRSVLGAGAARFLGLPVSAAFTLLTAHALISRSGAVNFAVVSLILSLATIIPFADFGLGAAVINSLSVSGNPAEDVGLHRLFLSSMRVLCCLAVVFLLSDVFITAMSWWPPILGLAKDRADVNIASGIVIALYSVSIPLSLGQRILVGIGRAGTVSALTAIVAPIAFLATMLCLQSGLPVAALAIATPVGMLLCAVLQVWLAHRWSGIHFRRQFARIFRLVSQRSVPVRHTAGPMLVITVALPVMLQSDRLVLSHYGDLYDVAAYSLALQVYTAVWTTLAAAALALWPVFARARNVDRQSSRDALRKSLAIFLPLGTLSVPALLIVMPLITGATGSGSVQVSWALRLAFAGLLLIQTIQLPLGMYMTSRRGLKFQAVCVATGVVVSVASSIQLTIWWGASGPVLGSIGAVLFCQLLPGSLWCRRDTRQAGRDPMKTPRERQVPAA